MQNISSDNVSHQWLTHIEDISDSEFSFSDDVLAAFDVRKYQVGDSYSGSVDLTKVRGCWHPDYRGRKWRELKPIPGTLKNDRANPGVGNQHLKRIIKNAQSLDLNPDYYLRDEEKHHWSFYEYNGFLYVEAGVHRTVLGRYFLAANDLPPLIHNVNIVPCSDKEELTELPQSSSRDHSMWMKVKQLWKSLI